MERTTFSPPKEHSQGRTEEPHSLDDGSKLFKEDPVIAFDLESSGTKQETHLRPNSAPEFAASILLPPFELSKANALESAVAEWTTEDPFMNDMPLETCGPLCKGKPRPVVSPWLNHSPPSLPFEDIIFDGEIGVIQTDAALVEDLSRQTKNAPVAIPDSSPTSLSAFSEILNNADVKSQHIEDVLSPAELVSFPVQSQRSVQPHENDFARLQTPHQIPEYSVPAQLQSEPNVWLQEYDQGCSSTAELGPSFPLPCFESTEKAAILPFKDILKPGQHVISQPHLGQSDPRDDTDLVSARRMQLPSTSVQPLRLGAGTFQDLSGPPRQFYAPFFSQHHSTKPHLNARQTPVLSDSDPQPVQLVRPPYLPLVLPLDVNCMQPDNQLASICFQPCLQPRNYLPHPFISEMRLLPASIAIDNWAPLVPQINLNSSSSVFVPHFNPPICYKDPLSISPDLQTNIISHPNTRGPLQLGGLEQPSVVQSTHDGHSHSQKLYENYRLWQIYCEVAKSVYTSSPDAEALACFFIPVIRSVTLQCPEIPFSEAVKMAVSEWEKHSNFDRMEYYHIAQRFMDFAEEKLRRQRAEEEARAIQETANHQQILILKHEQSTGYHLRKSGADSKGAKGGATTPHGGQTLRRDVEDLAEEALREYSEIMVVLETKNKGSSEEEEEVHHGDEEEGSFAEYLNELCSQKKFVSEVGAEIDMAYISSLLSSDSIAIDMLMQPEDLDNSQEVPNSVSVLSEACLLNGQITDCGSKNSPQTTSQFTETRTQKVKSKSDVARETSLFETPTVNELKTTEENDNECVIGKQKITEGMPDIQDNDGTDMAFIVMEDAVEQICSAAQLLHKDNSNVSVDCKAGHLEEVTLISRHSCSGLDPPRTFSPLASIATLERETPREDSETSPRVNRVCEEASQTDKQLNTPQQEGAVTDSKTEVSTTELSPAIVQHDDVVIQNKFTKHDPVTEDHSGKARDSIVRPPNTHEESSTNLVNTSTVSECLDVDTQSELSTTRLESTPDEADPKLATHLKDVAVEIPQEHVDGGTEEPTETDAEVTDNIDGRTDSEGTLTKEDEIKVSDVEIKGMTSNISQQTYVASPGCLLVQNNEQAADVAQTATEVLSATVEEGNTSTEEETTAENSLCMSEEALCLDQKTGLHKQDKGNIKSMSPVTTNAGELPSRNKTQTKPMEILNKNKCDDQKTRSDARANKIMTRSKTKAQKIEEMVGTASWEMEKMGLRKRLGDSFLTDKTSLTRKSELTLENAPVITEKGQTECECGLKKENRDMKKDEVQRRKDDHLIENTIEKATKTTINLEVGASLLKQESSESKKVSSKSIKTETAETRVQNKTGGNRSTGIQRNKSKRKMDIMKGLRREKTRMVKRQNLKVTETEVAQTVKDQRNEVMRSTRCKVKEILAEKQQRMINEEKMQTVHRSERLSKKEPEKNIKSDHCSVMDTRSFDSLRSDEAAGTSSVKMKTKKPNAGNPMEVSPRYHQVETEKVTHKASKMSNCTSVIQTGSFDSALLEEIQSRQIPKDSLVDIPRITRSFVANLVKRTRTTEKLVVGSEEVAQLMACSSKRAEKRNVRTEESTQLNRARGTRRCCARVAEDTAEELAKMKNRELSSDESERRDSDRCERRLSASMHGISIAVKDKSKETTENKNRDRKRRYDRVQRQNQANIRTKRQISNFTASRLLQMQKRRKEVKEMDETISKRSVEQKRRRFVREERDKAKKDADRHTIRRSAGFWRTLAARGHKHQEVTMRRKRMIQGEMETQRRRIRKEVAKGTTVLTHERKELENHQRSRRPYRGLKSHAWSRSLIKHKVLATPQTRQKVGRRNEGQKEMVESRTRPERVHSERHLGSLPIKKQKQLQVANPSNWSAEANDTPSSSKTLRRTIKRGSRAVTHRRKRGQQGSACSSSVLHEKTEGEKKGGERQSGRHDIPRVNKHKGQGGDFHQPWLAPLLQTGSIR
ncbi:hypothetical protein MHYP_G00244870 [Metynnis hypsauchen]